jgi:hypothetical protein
LIVKGEIAVSYKERDHVIEYLSVGDDLGSFCILGRRSHFDFSCLDDVLCMHLTRDQLFSIFFKYHKDKVDFIRRARMLNRSLHNKKNRLKSLQNAEKMLVALDSSPKVLGSLLLRNGVQRLDRNEPTGMSDVLKIVNSQPPQQRRRSTADDWDLEDGSSVRLNPSSNAESRIRNDWQIHDEAPQSKPKKQMLAAFDNTDDTEFSDIKQDLRLQKKSTTVELARDNRLKQEATQQGQRSLKRDASPPPSNRAQPLPGGSGATKTGLNVISPADRERSANRPGTEKLTLQLLDLKINSQLDRSLSSKTADAGGKSNSSFFGFFKSSALNFWNKVKEVAAIPEKYQRFEYRKDLMKKNSLDEQAYQMKKHRLTYYQDMVEKFEQRSNASASASHKNWQKLRGFCISIDPRGKLAESAKKPGLARQDSQSKQITKKQKKILAMAFIKNIMEQEQSSEESLNEEDAANVDCSDAEANSRAGPCGHIRQRDAGLLRLQAELRRAEQPRAERQ